MRLAPAEKLGLEAGATILSLRTAGDGTEIDLRPLASADPAERLRIWRSAYWLGLRGPVDLTVERGAVSRLSLDRPSVSEGARGVSVNPPTPR